MHDHRKDLLLCQHGPLRRVKAAGALVAVLTVEMSFAAAAEAQTSCEYVGAPKNALTVTVSGRFEAVITRRGQEIVAGDYGRPPELCAGATPTVTNTDTIDVLLSPRGVPSVEVLLRNGLLAPGATVESDGASEIELQVRGPGIAVDVVGTKGDDAFRWGLDGANPGLNVNANDGDDDVDVAVVAGPNAPVLYALGAGGNDTIIGQDRAGAGYVHAHGGDGNDVLTAPRGIAGAIFYGGRGNDVISGSRGGDVLGGDGGHDRIFGGAGADDITGGTGHDRIWGGAGRDLIRLRDRARDTASCGTGPDRINSDRRDRVTDCEITSRR